MPDFASDTQCCDESYKRIALEGLNEIPGANGEFGHDETSEDTRATWEQTYSPPTPGEVHPSLLGTQ